MRKKCLKCGKKRDLHNFKTRKNKTIEPQCRSCAAEYDRSLPRIASKIYWTKKRALANKGDETVLSYTAKELEKWISTQPNYRTLIERWKEFKYDKTLSLSCWDIGGKIRHLSDLELINYEQRIDRLASPSKFDEIKDLELRLKARREERKYKEKRAKKKISDDKLYGW